MTEILNPDLKRAYDEVIIAGTAKNTRMAYAHDLKCFWAWATQSLGISEHYPIIHEVLIRFILERTTQSKRPLRVSTIKRYMASISVAHQERGMESPTLHPSVKLLLRRTRNARAHQGTNKKAAITANILQQMLATCNDSLLGVRDKTILLVGFASGGRRRSELRNMRAEDLIKVEEGYLITLRSNKTDQSGKGLQVPILGDAATALKAWLVKSGIRRGYLFRSLNPRGHLKEIISGKTINRIIKQRIAMSGLNPDQYGAHSLRSGFITEAGRQGISLGEVIQLSHHKSLEIANQYYREGELLINPAGKIT